MSPFLAFAACAFASSFSLRLVDPLVLPIAAEFALDSATVALLSTAYAIPYALSQPVLGPLGDRLGRARCLQICMTGLAAVLTVGMLAPDFRTLAASRVLAGVFGGGLVPLVLAALGDAYDDSIERQVAIGRMLFAMIGGQMAGSVIAGVAAGLFGWRVAFAIADALALGAAGLAWTRLPRANAERGPRASMRQLYAAVFCNRKAGWLFAIVFVEAALFFGVFPHIGATLQVRGAATAADAPLRAGLVLGGFGIGGLLYALSVRRLLGALGVRRLCLAGSLAAMSAYLLLAVANRWPLFALALLVSGAAFYMIHNSLQAEATALAPTARGSAVALFAAALFLGQGIGPMLHAALVAGLGTTWTFALVAVAMVALGRVVVGRVVGSPVPTAAPAIV